MNAFLNSLFGTKYFGYIVSAYAVTFIVLMLMIIWVLTTWAKRKRALDRLEKAGIKRASRTDG